MNSRILKIRILPRWIIILIDLLLLAFSSAISYLLRFNLDYSKLNNYDVGKGILILVVSGFLSILFTRSYAGIVRYTGLQDGKRILAMSALALLFALSANYLHILYYDIVVLPHSVIIITFITSTLLLYAYRIGVKQVFSSLLNYKNPVKKECVAIFGTGHSAMIARQIIESDEHNNKKVALFFDIQKGKIGKIVDGVKVIDFRKDFYKNLELNDIRELIIAERNLTVELKNKVVDTCLRANVRIRTVPPVEHWMRGTFNVNQIRDINIEELLGRESIKLDNYNVREAIKGRKVMVTGAAGSIGSELVRQVLFYCPQFIVMVDQSESPLFELEYELVEKKGTIPIYTIIGDITNAERMEYVIAEYKPDIILHAAAYKHVPMMEKNVAEAVSCNIIGTKVIADLSVRYNVEKFVMISTDKAVNPTNVMGASKRLAEMYVQSLNNYLHVKNPEATKFITTRFGNVLGSNGSVIPLFKKQIQQGGPVTVTHPDITRFFMTIPEACQLVLEASVMGHGGEIFVFDMGKSIKIVDLAKKMIKLSGYELDKDIEIKYTGLREGEKLYEELLSMKENTVPTYHHKILIAKNQEVDFNMVKNKLQNLINAIDDKDEMKIVGIMKFIIPEYKSNFSKFEALDRKKLNITS